MDGMTLLREARSAGLSVWAEGDRLVIRGPRRAEPVVRVLIAHKPDVMTALSPPAHTGGCMERRAMVPALPRKVARLARLWTLHRR